MLIGYLDMSSPPHKLELDSSLESIDVVEKLIYQFKEIHSIKDEHFHEIWIALNEAVTNAIIHGNKYDPTKKVGLTIETKEDRFLCFTINDEGCGFDPTNLPDPTLPEFIEEPNGRGVFLIHKLADRVCFLNNGSTLEMWFDLYKN